MIKLIRAVTVSQSIGFYKPMIPDLQAQEYEVVSVSSPGPEVKALRDMGVKCIELPMERHISLSKDMASLCKLIKVFRKERPDMIHSMTPKAGLLCMMAAKITRVPIRIHTFTGLVWPTATGIKRKILMLTDWLTCACATHIIPEGEGVKNDLLSHGITHKPLKVLGYGNVRGIDLNRFNRSPEVMREAEKIAVRDSFTFIFIGRIVRDKGINELVAAFKRLQLEIPKIRLVMVGQFEDNLDPVTNETKKEIECNKRIVAVGVQRDVRPWLASADALVFPSFREGFPNVVIEAGAMGLPSIVTDINGSREIIQNGVNGSVVPSQDENALYEAMKKFVTDQSFVSILASHARDMVANRYEQGYVKQCLLDFYKSVVYNENK